MYNMIGVCSKSVENRIVGACGGGGEGRFNYDCEFARPITCPSPTNHHLVRRARERADGRIVKIGAPFPPVHMPLRIAA